MEQSWQKQKGKTKRGPGALSCIRQQGQNLQLDNTSCGTSNNTSTRVAHVDAGHAVVPDVTSVAALVLAAAAVPLIHALPEDMATYEHCRCGSINIAVAWPLRPAGFVECVVP